MASADVDFDSCFEVVSKLVEEAGKVSFRLQINQWKQILKKDLKIYSICLLFLSKQWFSRWKRLI